MVGGWEGGRTTGGGGNGNGVPEVVAEGRDV